MLVTLKQLQLDHLPGYGLPTLRAWARRGLFPTVRVGRKVLVDPGEVLAALRLHTAEMRR